MTVTSFIALGSNLGEPENNVKQALHLMNAHPEIKVLRVAPLYLTEPVGYEDQEWFHNTVAEIETALSPRQLMEALQVFENQLGRVRTIRWGPRTIDLDIALFDDRVINEPDLEIPHPRMEERAFVLAPLADLVPELTLPSGRPIKDVLNQVTGKKFVCIKKKIW